MKNINVLLLSGLLLTLACSPIKNDAVPDIPGMDPTLVEKAEGQFCARNQKLKELTSGTNVPFSNLTRQSKVFAFSTTKIGNARCIIQGAINDQVRRNDIDMWFNLNSNANNNCLKNNSIWEVQSTHNVGNEQFFYLRNVDDTNPRLMEMSAHKDLIATYARDRVGLKLLECQ